MRNPMVQDEAMLPCLFTANCAGKMASPVHGSRVVGLALEVLAVLFLLVLVLF